MRSRTFIAVGVVLVVLLGGAAGVYAYDRAHRDRIAEGITVGGIEVGGLERAAAHRKLERELVAPLSTPVVVRSRGRRFTLTAQVAEIHADVDGMVDDAIARTRRGNPLSRTIRGLTGGRIEADVEPDVSYSAQAVSNLVRRIARTIDRDPRNASVEFSTAGVTATRSHSGLRINRRRLRERVEQAILRPADNQRIVTATVRKKKPKVTTRQLLRKYATVITIDRGGFRLRLFKNLKLVKAYPIAVGQVGLETPAGMYNVQNKAINPAWTVPNSAWAGDLAGTVVPGGIPSNPLKARWLGIYNGAGIHGTDAVGSIGSNASHGCIRMLIPDVVELYDQVPVGAPVYIA